MFLFAPLLGFRIVFLRYVVGSGFVSHQRALSLRHEDQEEENRLWLGVVLGLSYCFLCLLYT